MCCKLDTAPELSPDLQIEDLGDLILAPGVIDAHVHINDPGRTEWEGFETATKAAAAGGVTTVVDMPLNSSPVTTSVAALDAKRAAALGKCWVNVGFYGGLIPGNARHIEPLLDAGVLGVKAFVCHSGLDEFPNATLADLQAAAPILARHNRPLLVHAELTDAPAPRPQSARSYADYLASRPPQWESDAIGMLINLCRGTGCHVQVVHLANADALKMLHAARNEGLPITVETCPHYLHFTAESIPDADTRYKCAPPIREEHHRERLWDALKNGDIDTIGSDHSPCLPSMKCLESGDFMAAWGGIASLQLTLPIVWTNAAHRGIPLARIFEWLSGNPAKLVGLANRKGRIAKGFDADLIVFDPDAGWTVHGEQLYHRHKLTPYDGERLTGKVLRTYVGGIMVFGNNGLSHIPTAELLAAPWQKLTENQSVAEFLGRLDDAALRLALTKCCASRRWVSGMVAARPFLDEQHAIEAASNIWWHLDREDWLEAFAAHPKIGDLDSLRAKFADTRTWAGGEQSGVKGASQATIERLARSNREYEIKFGYIFIVCASGKTADEMLAILESRLPNNPEIELRIAAAEQWKITELRLRKLV